MSASGERPSKSSLIFAPRKSPASLLSDKSVYTTVESVIEQLLYVQIISERIIKPWGYM